MSLEVIEKINNIIDIFNSISIAVNGSGADTISKYEINTATEDLNIFNEYKEDIVELYNYNQYLSFLQFSKKNIDSAKKGDYKSQVSERMKIQLINSIDITKSNIMNEIHNISIILENKEQKYAEEILSMYSTKKIEEDNIIQLFNNICKTFLKIQSLFPSIIIKTFEEQKINKIFKLNLSLIISNLRPLEVRKYDKAVEIKETLFKKITYPKYFNFNKIFLKTDYKLSTLDKEVSGSLEKINNEIEVINYFLTKALSIDLTINKEVSGSLENKTLLHTIESHISGLSDKLKPIIIFLKTESKDYIYITKNLLESEEVSNSREISGITKEYVNKTNTIIPHDSKDLEGVEEYISPISIKESFIYNYIDIMESKYKSLEKELIIIRIDKNLKKSTMFYNLKLLDCLELLNINLFNVNSILNNQIYDYSIYKIKESIEDNINLINKGDMNVFNPVKMSDIRANVLAGLKDYKRDENKLENTNKIIKLIFNSIYKSIWQKTPKTKDFNDEFYITFYASINRLVFKARKDFMDRYNIMRNYDSAKEIVMDILEKMEKNILKADEMITIKYRLIN